MSKVGGSYSYNVICDVCGFQFKSHEMRRRWDGAIVCKQDWEMRHPLDFYKTRDDTHKLPFQRPNDTPTPETAFGWTYDTDNFSLETTVDVAEPTLFNTFTLNGDEDVYISGFRFWHSGKSSESIIPVTLTIHAKLSFASYTLRHRTVCNNVPNTAGWIFVPTTPMVLLSNADDTLSVQVGIKYGYPSGTNGFAYIPYADPANAPSAQTFFTWTGSGSSDDGDPESGSYTDYSGLAVWPVDLVVGATDTFLDYVIP